MRPLMNEEHVKIFDIVNANQDSMAACLAVIQQLRDENASLRQQVDRLSTFRTLAFHDELTGLFNRRSFEERLGEEWCRVARYDDTLTLILIDLDDFKLINDTAGHAAGDAVLALIGRVMTDTCRDCDIPYRLGGDEFAYLLPSTDREGAEALIERVYEAVAAREGELNLPAGLRVKLSCGVATHDEARTPSALVNCADQEMYANKRTRKSAA